MRRIRLFFLGPRIFGIRPGVSFPADSNVLLFALRTAIYMVLNIIAYACLLVWLGDETVKTLPDWTPWAFAFWTIISSVSLAHFLG